MAEAEHKPGNFNAPRRSILINRGRRGRANVADYGPGLNIFVGRVSLAERMSLSPDGKSFAVGLTNGPAIQSDLWILEGLPK